MPFTSRPLISAFCFALGVSFASTVAIASNVATAPVPTAAPASSDIMGFQAWKGSRVEDARAILERLQLTSKSPTSPKGNGVKKVEPKSDRGTSRFRKAADSDQKLQQAQIDLEIAQEFTVNDYFVLYLSQFKNRDAFVEAAKHLTPEETAELMIAFQRNLTGNGLAETTGSRPAPNVAR